MAVVGILVTGGDDLHHHPQRSHERLPRLALDGGEVVAGENLVVGRPGLLPWHRVKFDDSRSLLEELHPLCAVAPAYLIPLVVLHVLLALGYSLAHPLSRLHDCSFVQYCQAQVA